MSNAQKAAINIIVPIIPKALCINEMSTLYRYVNKKSKKNIKEIEIVKNCPKEIFIFLYNVFIKIHFLLYQ